ncbi:hypothetical protein E8E12_000885 [Didymella heteroderae]|uniref:GH16 domain-containing protein n=1 Tax=Didymella heteroderae TaxID=1769908 RepID=A0A9P4WFR2_9PLEO|nr:hypothetical protein E8E12_000885 [Didymella heteroderae]
MRRYLLVGILASIVCESSYTVDKKLDASNFLDSFDFISNYDIYTNGSTSYVSKHEAQLMGLVRSTESRIYLGVDNGSVTNVLPRGGRRSFRLESHDTIDNGMIIVDFEHIPANACGMWPAFWLLHDSETYSEIDIVESVSFLSRNEITLYTGPDQCSMEARNGSGDVFSTRCDYRGEGCGATAPNGTFGDSFNRNGGGVLATEIDVTGIRVWQFARSMVPESVKNESPDPNSWGTPVLHFVPKECDIRAAWTKMKIIINITFCGKYAGAKAWEGYTGCRARTGVETCEQYVAQNPSAFDDVYYLINSISTFR